MASNVQAFANYMQVRRVPVKKCRGPESPLYTVLYPMICIIKVFGQAPYEFSRDQMVPSNIQLIFSVLIFAIYIYEMSVICIAFETPTKESLSRWTWVVLVVFNFGVAMYEIFLAVFTRKSFVRVWNTIQDYDEAVRRLGYPRKETRTGIVAWSVLILQSSIWILINLAGMHAFNEKWLYNVAYMSIYLGPSIALNKFVGIAYLLAQRFSHLAELAVKNLPSRSGFMNPSKVTRKTVQDLHNDLLVASESLDSMYCWSLFLWLGDLCMHSVSNTYFIIKWLIQRPFNPSAGPAAGCYGAWLLGFLVQLLLVHTVCDYTSKRANDMYGILVDWNARLAKRFPKTEVVVPTIHLLNRKLQFSAAGCFYVDLPLLRSIAALLATYLIIMLQLPD